MQPTLCSQPSSCSCWGPVARLAAGQSVSEHPDREHLPAVPDALHLSEGAGSQKKKEHMSRKQLIWVFPDWEWNKHPLSLTWVGVWSLVGDTGHLSPLYRHIAAARMLLTRMLNPSCLARHFPARPDPLNYFYPRKPGAELGLGEGEAPVNTAFPSG